MAKMKITPEKAIENIINNKRKTLKEPSLLEFVDRLYLSRQLVHFVKQRDDNQEYQYKLVLNEASKSLVVTIVSGIEVYLKEIINEVPKRWSQTGVNALLESQNVSLLRALQLFKYPEITPASIIAEAYSIQSVENIKHVMGKLGGCDFFDELDDTDFGTDDGTTLKNIIPKWKSDLKTLYHLRNRIVHDSNVDLLVSLEDALQFHSLALTFIIAVNTWAKHPNRPK